MNRTIASAPKLFLADPADVRRGLLLSRRSLIFRPVRYTHSGLVYGCFPDLSGISPQAGIYLTGLRFGAAKDHTSCRKQTNEQNNRLSPEIVSR